MILELEEPFNSNCTVLEDITAPYEILRSTCTTARSLKAGRIRFSHALLKKVGTLMSYALLALDDCPLALSCATGKDIELEAKTVFYLAKAYHMLLKSEGKTDEPHIRAISLFATLSPMVPQGTRFTEARNAVEAHRAVVKAKKDNGWYQRR